MARRGWGVRADEAEGPRDSAGSADSLQIPDLVRVAEAPVQQQQQQPLALQPRRTLTD